MLIYLQLQPVFIDFLSIILPSHTPHDKFIAIPAIDNNVLTLNFNP